jgi:Rrf2 family iron-sulfur cluster assembly transcriptional regulator
LAIPSDQIFVVQIINAVNESIDTTSCRGKGDCQGGEICLTHSLWQELSVQIHEFLNGISLADLVAKRDTQQIAQRQIDQLLVLDDNLQAQAC